MGTGGITEESTVIKPFRKHFDQRRDFCLTGSGKGAIVDKWILIKVVSQHLNVTDIQNLSQYK